MKISVLYDATHTIYFDIFEMAPIWLWLLSVGYHPAFMQATNRMKAHVISYQPNKYDKAFSRLVRMIDSGLK